MLLKRVREEKTERRGEAEKEVHIQTPLILLLSPK